jgi:hypothetical protein
VHTSMDTLKYKGSSKDILGIFFKNSVQCVGQPKRNGYVFIHMCVHFIECVIYIYICVHTYGYIIHNICIIQPLRKMKACFFCK